TAALFDGLVGRIKSDHRIRLRNCDRTLRPAVESGTCGKRQERKRQDPLAWQHHLPSPPPRSAKRTSFRFNHNIVSSGPVQREVSAPHLFIDLSDSILVHVRWTGSKRWQCAAPSVLPPPSSRSLPPTRPGSVLAAVCTLAFEPVFRVAEKTVEQLRALGGLGVG